MLTQIELASDGKFLRSMLAGSGVSGGSLGLALFDAMLQATSQGAMSPKNHSDVVNGFLETDFLAPTMQTMFLADSTQRWIPGAWFIDRVQRLELAFEQTWKKWAVCKPNPLGSAHQDALACELFSPPGRLSGRETLPSGSSS